MKKELDLWHRRFAPAFHLHHGLIVKRILESRYVLLSVADYQLDAGSRSPCLPQRGVVLCVTSRFATDLGVAFIHSSIDAGLTCSTAHADRSSRRCISISYSRQCHDLVGLPCRPSCNTLMPQSLANSQPHSGMPSLLARPIPPLKMELLDS